MRIIECLTMVVTKQVRFPRSKRRRIKNKWAKNPNNSRTEPDTNSLIAGDVIYCHPVVAAEIRRQFKKPEWTKNTFIGGSYGGAGIFSPFGGMSINEL